MEIKVDIFPTYLPLISLVSKATGILNFHFPVFPFSCVQPTWVKQLPFGEGFFHFFHLRSLFCKRLR